MYVTRVIKLVYMWCECARPLNWEKPFVFTLYNFFYFMFTIL